VAGKVTESDFQQGYRYGERYVADVMRQRRVGIHWRRPGAEGLKPPYGDLIEAAAAGYVPEDVVKRSQREVPSHAQADWTAGFCSACRDHIERRDLGLGDN
jgi:hypothetical protein